MIITGVIFTEKNRDNAQYIYHIRCSKKLISICDPWAETTTAVWFEIIGFSYNKPKTLQVIQSVEMKKYNRTKRTRQNTSSVSTGSI